MTEVVLLAMVVIPQLLQLQLRLLPVEVRLRFLQRPQVLLLHLQLLQRPQFLLLYLQFLLRFLLLQLLFLPVP